VFCKNVSESHWVIEARVLAILDGNTSNSMEVEVLTNIYNTIDQDTILIEGNNGANCGENLYRFSRGDRLILALDSFTEDTWHLSGSCGRHFLDVDENEVKGQITPTQTVVDKQYFIDNIQIFIESQPITFASQFSIDSFFVANPNITVLPTDIVIYNDIEGDDPIVDLTPFGNIQYIKGRITLFDLVQISDLSGFSNLESIYGTLHLLGKMGFSDFTGLDKLSYIEGLFIDRTEGLLSFKGLEGITAIPTHFTIQQSSVESLDGLENVVSAGSITLQNENGLKIQTLEGLSGLERIERGLTILGSRLDPDEITKLGLNKLTHIGSSISIQYIEKVSEIGFLSNFSKINGDLKIHGLPNLSLESLNNIDTVTSIFSLSSISTVSDLIDLQGLLYVGNSFIIGGFGSLMSFNGINDSLFVKNKISIVSNPILEDISSLEQLDHETLTEILIFNNLKLDHCSIQSVCNFIKSGKSARISRNGTACSDLDEIIKGCTDITIGNIQTILDLNDNGTFDEGEPFYNDALITVKPSSDLFNPNSSNNGRIFLDVGRSYEFLFEEANNPLWQSSSFPPTPIITAADSIIDTITFLLSPKVLLSATDIDLYVPPQRCNTRSTIKAQVKNIGNTTITGLLLFRFGNDNTHKEYVTPPDAGIGSPIVGWQFTNLYPGQSFERYIIDSIGFGEIGEILRYDAWSVYQDKLGNYIDSTYHNSTILCAYDPNDKKITPNRESGIIYNQEELKYTIRFQNIGNAEAIDVRIIDSLDSDLDVSTFQLINSSHSEFLSTRIDSNRVVHFDFININLPDSTSNPELSQGYVTFTIDYTLKDYPLVSVENHAAIFFDKNPPIITNDVKTFILDTLRIKPGGFPDCFDNIDNDNDGLIDCYDPDCATVDTACPGILNSLDSSIGDVLRLYVYLEGALDTSGFMTTTLYDKGYLPTLTPTTLLGSSQPRDSAYLLAPWESDYNLEDYNFNHSVVDFVLVRVQTTELPDSEVCNFIGILRPNGWLTIPDTLCSLDGTLSYYFVIEHRNHLAVMTPEPVSFIDGGFSFDFRSQDSYTGFIGSGQKEIADGVYAMYAGNTDQYASPSSRVDINTTDIATMLSDFGDNSNYLRMDLDLNGDVNFHDLSILLRNQGVFSGVKF